MIILEKRNSNFFSKVLFHVPEILFSRQLILCVSDKFVEPELTGLLEIILEDKIALGNTLAEEKGFLFFFIMKFLFIKLRERVFA